MLQFNDYLHQRLSCILLTRFYPFFSHLKQITTLQQLCKQLIYNSVVVEAAAGQLT